MTEAPWPYNISEANSMSSPPGLHAWPQRIYSFTGEAHQLSLLLLLLQRKQTVISTDPSLGTWAGAVGDLMGLCSVGLPNREESCWASTEHFSL